MIGIQQKNIVLGHDPSKIPFDKINLQSRSGGELALGHGGEKTIFYSNKTLQHLVDKKFIDQLSKDRAQATVRLEEATHASKGKEFVGDIGRDGFKKVSNEQGDFLLKKTASLQSKGEIDVVHGSIATRVNVEPSLRGLSGDILKMGDLDIVPKASKNMGFEDRASKLIKEYYDEFPLSKGESKSFVDKAGSNRELHLIKADGRKEKIFEVVMKTSDESPIGKTKDDPTKILDYKMPFDKKVKATDYPIETKTLEYQGLTQTKTILSFQKSLDPTVKAKIYTARGREKDIVRRYWQARQSELNQIRAGKPLTAAKTREAAEKFKLLYPELDFTKISEEKVVLNLSSRTGESTKNSSSVIESTIPTITVKTNPSIINSISEQKIGSNVMSKPTNQNELKSELSKLYEKYDNSRPLLNSQSTTHSMIPRSNVKLPSRIQPRSNVIPRRIDDLTSRSGTTSPRSIRSHSVRPPSTKPPSVKLTRSKSPSIVSSNSKSQNVKISSPVNVLNLNVNAITSKSKSRRKPAPNIIDMINTTKKKPDKVKFRRNFVGNVRQDNIIGIFKRSEIIEDKKRFGNKVNKIIAQDKKRFKSKSNVMNIFSDKKKMMKIKF